MNELHILDRSEGVETTVHFVAAKLRVLMHNYPKWLSSRMSALVDVETARHNFHHLLARQKRVMADDPHVLRLIGNEIKTRTFCVEHLAATDGESRFRLRIAPEGITKSDIRHVRLRVRHRPRNSAGFTVERNRQPPSNAAPTVIAKGPTFPVTHNLQWDSERRATRL